MIWLRMLLASAVFIWLPGQLLIGRWLGGKRPLDRLVLSVAVGLTLPFLYNALIARFGVPFAPLPYVVFALGLGVAAHFWRPWRELGRSWTDLVPEPGRWGSWAAAASIPLILVPVLLAHGSLSAPPHVDDASNHAWITLRVVETEELHPDIVRGEGPGFVDAYYAPGLHAPAALLARFGGVAPYIATWLLVVLILGLIPASWSILWRAWGLPSGAVALGVLFATATSLGPAGVLSWGGFGQILGFFMVPVGTLALRAAWREPGPGHSISAGILLGAMAFLHFSEVFVAMGAALLISGVGVRSSRIRSLFGLTIVLGTMAFIALPELLAVSQHYGTSNFLPALETKRFGDALERWSRAGGRDLLQVLFVLGFIFGILRRDTRKLALVALGLGAWYLSLQVFADPISQWLAHPFYRQAARILYLQLYLLPPLLALPLLFLMDLSRRRGRARVGQLTAAALVLVALGMGLERVTKVLHSFDVFVPFTVEDYAHAREIASVVPEGDVVANLWRDGSTWAMHVSGCRFLQPAAWAGVDSQGQNLQLLLSQLVENPWPSELAELLERDGIDWLYVSDTVMGDGPHGLRRVDFAGDPRFEERIRGEDSSLYRLLPSKAPGRDSESEGSR